MTHPEIDPAAEVRRALEASLYECKRVVVGQDAMLERLLVALLTGGHVLLEGVPGLAKTLTVRTLATVLGGTLRPHPVHARPRPGRPRRHAHLAARRRHASGPSSARSSPTSCSPTRSTARPRRCSRRCSRSCRSTRSRSAARRYRVPEPVPRARDAEPDRVRGHLRPPGGAGRPLPVQARRRLPGASRTRSPSSTASSRRDRRARSARSTSRTCSATSETAREVVRRALRSSPTPSRWSTPPATRRATASPTSSR